MNVSLTSKQQIEERTPFALIRLGNLHASAGNHKEAIKHFNEAIIMRPNEARPHFLRGVAEFHLSLFGKSLRSLLVALKTNPANKHEILNYTGAIRFKLGDYKNALFDIIQALQYFKGDISKLKISPKEFAELLQKES